MPGIFGTTLREDGASRLESMREALRSSPYLAEDPDVRVGRVEGSRVSLQRPGNAPSPSTRPGLTLWLEGEAYDAAPGLSGPVSAHASLGDKLLDAYAADRLPELLAGVDGYFCGALYDQRRETVTLFTDRYGMRLLYFHTGAGGFAWASEVKALLALDYVSRAVDERAASCVLGIGYLLEARTWYRDVQLVEPATIMQVSLASGARESRRYWRWSDLQPSELSFDDAVDHAHELLAAGVRRRVSPDERLGITLSGGLDSRALLATTATHCPEARGLALTYGHPGSDDVRFATRAAAVARWPHQKFDFPVDWLAARLGSVWRTDGAVSLMHQHGAEFFHHVHDEVDVVLNGYAGDVIAGGGWLESPEDGGRVNRNRLRDHYGAFLDDLEVDPSFYGTHNLEPHLLMNRVRRYTLMGTVNTLPFFEQRKPFFDNAFLALMMTLPSSYRKGGRLYRALLLRHFPSYFRSIPWQKTGLPISAPRWAEKLNKRRRSVGLRLSTLLHLPQRRPLGFVNYRERLRDPAIRQWLRALLAGRRTRLGDVVDPAPARALLDRFDGLRDVSEPLFRYVTIEIWLRALDGAGPWRGLPRDARPMVLPDPDSE